MADGLLDMIIQSADFEKLNVKPGDVLKGKLYVGPADLWINVRNQ